MKQNVKTKIVLALLAVIMPAATWAHDFSVTLGGNTMYFKITDHQAHTACLTYRGNIADHHVNPCKGTIKIPATVRHGDAVYTINAIGPKALAGAEGLDTIIMPATISQVGDFAFEGCTQLTHIVMPEGQPTFGQGTFFRCTAISSVEFGDEWKEINFTMFRWTDSLHIVNIPSKVERMQGLKTLRGLTTINVAGTNTNYKSADGVLYSSTAPTLLCVPRAYKGSLNVAEGTTTILWGSMIDCTLITDIVLPASVQKLSFREFSRMERLQTLTIKAETPIHTANYEGRDTPALAVANPQLTLMVPAPAVKAYKKALCAVQGEYYDIVTNRPETTLLQDAAKPYTFEKQQMLQPAQIKKTVNK